MQNKTSVLSLSCPTVLLKVFNNFELNEHSAVSTGITSLNVELSK